MSSRSGSASSSGSASARSRRPCRTPSGAGARDRLAGASLRDGERQGPGGILRVPAAALSAVEMTVTSSGIPAVGYYAQVPPYIATSAYARPRWRCSSTWSGASASRSPWGRWATRPSPSGNGSTPRSPRTTTRGRSSSGSSRSQRGADAHGRRARLGDRAVPARTAQLGARPGRTRRTLASVTDLPGPVDLPSLRSSVRDPEHVARVRGVHGRRLLRGQAAAAPRALRRVGRARR